LTYFENAIFMLGCVGEAKPSDEQEVSCEQGLGTESDKEQTLQFGYLKLFCFRYQAEIDNY
jgi:hypothetical protein